MLFLLIFFFPHDLGAVSFLEQGHCLPAEVLFWNSHRFQQGATFVFSQEDLRRPQPHPPQAGLKGISGSGA